MPLHCGEQVLICIRLIPSLILPDMSDRLQRLFLWCAARREAVAATLFYAALVLGVALQSVSWALVIGGGLGLFIMVLWRILMLLTAWFTESPSP